MDLGSMLFSDVTEWGKILALICNLKTDLWPVVGIVRDGRYGNSFAFRASSKGFPYRDSLAYLKIAAGIRIPVILENIQVTQDKDSISLSQ